MAQFGTYLDFYMFLREEGSLKDFDRLYLAILRDIPSEVSPEDSKTIHNYVRQFTVNLNRKWTECSRSQITFMNKYRKWLETDIEWPTDISVNLRDLFTLSGEDVECAIDNSLELAMSTSTAKSDKSGTRTRKAFTDLGNKQKRRRTCSLSEFDEEQLTFALVTRLKSSGKGGLASIIEHLVKCPEKVSSVKSFLFDKKPQKALLQEDATLALVTSLDLSKWKYLTLRTIFSSSEDSPAIMSYQKLLEAKKRCYPKEEDIEITEKGASVKLQSLLDLTAQKILRIVDEKLDAVDGSLKLTSKWGFDGSSSQSNYKQRCENDLYESSVFMTSLVPLKLEANNSVLWENPTPSSTFYCRPVRFQFAKETVDFFKQEEAKMNDEIRNLIVSVCGNFLVHHELHMTMIDGKVATIVSGTSSAATCNVCLMKPSGMNDLSSISRKPIREDVLKFGLSSLHMWIRCMECLLHISYNLDFKLWSARGEHKNLKEARKEKVQAKFKEQMGLVIDVVKQGFGTTNDGNTARRFFRDYEKSAAIIEINEDLVKSFAVILQVISCGNAINVDKFRSYCWKTAELYVEHYSWYYMPASVHKLLIHGADICEHFPCLPIGILSEEAAEARNKDFRNTREYHTRKSGRKQNNEDILYRLLLTSDPYLSHIRPRCSRSTKIDLLPEATELLQLQPDECAEDVEEIQEPVPDCH